MRKIAVAKQLFVILLITASALYVCGTFNLVGQLEATAWDIPPKHRPPVSFDVYTQRGGKGSNVFAGTFKPDEEVFLIVEIMENDFPVENQSVTFEVVGPPNSYQNISAIARTVTNSSGIGSARLKISSTSEQPTQAVVGIWAVQSQVGLDQDTIGDAMDFEVVLTAPEFPILAPVFLAIAFTTATVLIFRKRTNG
jgi:hypothetical protein